MSEKEHPKGCRCGGWGWVHKGRCHDEMGVDGHVQCSQMPCPEPEQPASNVRIVSDGTPQGTKVYTGDREITGVRSVSWSASAEGIPVAQLELVGVQIDALGEVARRLRPVESALERASLWFSRTPKAPLRVGELIVKAQRDIEGGCRDDEIADLVEEAIRVLQDAGLCGRALPTTPLALSLVALQGVVRTGVKAAEATAERAAEASEESMNKESIEEALEWCLFWARREDGGQVEVAIAKALSMVREGRPDVEIVRCIEEAIRRAHDAGLWGTQLPAPPLASCLLRVAKHFERVFAAGQARAAEAMRNARQQAADGSKV